MNSVSNRLIAPGLAAMSMLMAGCVYLPKDRGASNIDALLASRTDAKVEWSSERCAQGSGKQGVEGKDALTADEAVATAFRCSSVVKALSADLALTQAEVYEATRLANPRVGLARLTGGQPEIVSTTWNISQRFVELLLLPVRQKIARDEWLAAQQLVADAVLKLEYDVRRAYVVFASAVSLERLQAQVSLAAELSAQAAQAYFEAGNISELQLSREQANAIEAKLSLEQAKSQTALARSDLFNAIGIAPHDLDAVALPQELAIPKPLDFDVSELRKTAREQRLDLSAARSRLSAFEKQKRQQKWGRSLEGAEVGFEVDRETGKPTLSGATAAVELPLFNTRKHYSLRVAGQLERAQAELQRIELEIDNDAAAAIANVLARQNAAKLLREKLVPLRERITALSQREFNYTFVGTFELLAIKREELDSYRQYVEAIREEWLAQIHMQRIAGGRLPTSAVRTEVQP